MQEIERFGTPAVIVVPIGFISDHVEVIWDLDTGREALTIPGRPLISAPEIAFSPDGVLLTPLGITLDYSGATFITVSFASWVLPLGEGGAQGLYVTYSLIVATFLGTMGLPHVVVRFYTNPDGRAARREPVAVIRRVKFRLRRGEQLQRLRAYQFS